MSFLNEGRYSLLVRVVLIVALLREKMFLSIPIKLPIYIYIYIIFTYINIPYLLTGMGGGGEGGKLGLESRTSCSII